MWFTNTVLQFGLTALLLQGSDAKVVLGNKEVCVTRRTTVSRRGAVPTYHHYNTIVNTVTAYVTKTPVKTVTPPPTTRTITSSTTKTTVVDVTQKTVTVTATSFTTTTTTTEAPTSTSTSATVTTTSSTSTVQGPLLVPTPAGFVPVQSSLPGSAAKRRRAVSKGTSLRPGAFATRNKKVSLCPVTGGSPPRSWPVSVDCYGTVKKTVYKTIYRTSSKTIIVTARRQTSTTTTTRTFTSTSFSTTPDAISTFTTTSTDTSVSTITPSTTTTSTSTVTVVVPTYTATAYAQCADNNIAGTVSGVGVNTAFSNNNQNFNTLNAAAALTAADCCNTCAANPLCVATAFEGTFPAGQQCFLIVSTQATCAAGDYSLAAVINNPVVPPDGGYILSNGNCGIYNTISQ